MEWFQRSCLLHSIVRLPVLHVLAVLTFVLCLVLDVVALVDVPQNQVVQHVLARLLQQLLEQSQGHNADLHRVDLLLNPENITFPFNHL